MLTMRWRDEVAEAEQRAHELMEACGFRVWSADDDMWVRTFGDSEDALHEHKCVLERRVQSIPVWRRRERHAAIRAYIVVSAMLTAGHGLETVWR